MGQDQKQIITHKPQVYFKSGKKLFYDKIWRDKNTVFVVFQDKKFAIGYDENEIDMEKTFTK